MKTTLAWAVLWRSENLIDGKREHLVGTPWFPLHKALFSSRRKAREYVNVKYSYIKNRKDLRQEPHGWKIPRVVRVKIQHKITVIKRLPPPPHAQRQP